MNKVCGPSMLMEMARIDPLVFSHCFSKMILDMLKMNKNNKVIGFLLTFNYGITKMICLDHFMVDRPCDLPYFSAMNKI